MVLPNLLHPIPIQVSQLDTSGTLYDDEAREPIQQATRSSVVTIPGQVKYGSSREASFHLGGLRENERGYVLFRQVDLDAQSVTLKINDRIVKIGQITQSADITRIEPMGHYPDQNGASLIRVYFSDRAPSKQRS